MFLPLAKIYAPVVRDIERYAFVIWSDCVARDISIAMRCRDIDGKAVVICRELRDVELRDGNPFIFGFI